MTSFMVGNGNHVDCCLQRFGRKFQCKVSASTHHQRPLNFRRFILALIIAFDSSVNVAVVFVILLSLCDRKSDAGFRL